MRRLRAVAAALVAAVVVSTLGVIVGPTAAQANETADWLPFKVGNGVVEVGCTWNNGCSGGYHGYYGIDFIVPNGTAIYAAGAGTVAAANGSCAATCDSRGRYVEISHPDSRKSRYLHLSSTSVAANQVVSRGQLIGYSGDTMANGVPHLHYDEVVGGVKVDPGPMNAVHGTTLVSYPSALDYATWNLVPSWANKFVWNDSYTPGASLADGSFVSYNGGVYIIAGGAPLYVSGADAPHLPGWTSATSITAAQWAALRPYPADGTYLSDVQTGKVYRVAGGAPLYISGADAGALPGWTTALRVPHWDFVAHQHLRPYPANGTFLANVQNGGVYMTVGGAPLYVSGADAAHLPGWTAATPVPGWDFTHYEHLRQYPADYLFVSDVQTGKVYTTAGGALLYVAGADAAQLPGWAHALRIPGWEIANPQHIRQYPADGTFLANVANGGVYVMAGGAPLYISGENAQYLPGWENALRVSGWDFANHVSLRPIPADGTYLRGVPSNQVYLMTNGVPVATASNPPSATNVDDTAITALGGTA